MLIPQMAYSLWLVLFMVVNIMIFSIFLSKFYNNSKLNFKVKKNSVKSFFNFWSF